MGFSMSRFSFDSSSRVLRIGAFIKQIAMEGVLRDSAFIDLLIPFAHEDLSCLRHMGTLYVQYVDGNTDIARYEIRETLGDYREYKHFLTFDVKREDNNNTAIESLLQAFNKYYGDDYRVEYKMALEGIKGLSNPAKRFFSKIGITGKSKSYRLFDNDEYKLTIDGSFHPNGVKITFDHPSLRERYVSVSKPRSFVDCRDFMIEKEIEQLFSRIFNLGF